MGRSGKEQTARENRYETGGERTVFRHKERHISSRSAACATGFLTIFELFLAALARAEITV
jgi:hypothetical protein